MAYLRKMRVAPMAWLLATTDLSGGRDELAAVAEARLREHLLHIPVRVVTSMNSPLTEARQAGGAGVGAAAPYASMNSPP